MPALPLTMHQIRELLRLHAAQLSQPQIARALNLSLGVINKHLQAARRAGLSWPLPDDLGDEQLRRLLFPDRGQAPSLPKVLPDFAHIHQELKRISGRWIHTLNACAATRAPTRERGVGD